MCRKHFVGVQTVITLKCSKFVNIICDAHKVKSCHVFKLSFELASISIVPSRSLLLPNFQFYSFFALPSNAKSSGSNEKKRQNKDLQGKQLVVRRRSSTSFHIHKNIHTTHYNLLIKHMEAKEIKEIQFFIFFPLTFCRSISTFFFLASYCD